MPNALAIRQKVDSCGSNTPFSIFKMVVLEISISFANKLADFLLFCAAWVIYNENLDYLHCNDLAWDGKTKCD